MRQLFDEVLRVRVSTALSQRLRTAANRYARSVSDLTRESLVLQVERLEQRANCSPNGPEAT